MKKLSLLLAFGLAAAHAWAAPVCGDNTPLSTYLVSGYSCQIGDKTFSNFNYVSSAQGGAVAITPAGITVDTLGPLGSGASIVNNDIGLQFNANWSATAGQVTDSNIGFTVTVNGGGAMLIDDTGLAQISGVSPNGSASVAERGCGPAPCTPNTISVLTFDNGGPTSQTVLDTYFTPVGSLAVMKDIAVSGGTSGFATLSLVDDTFSQIAVPEPMSMGLLGGGLALLGLARRRRLAKQS